jgi:hypothetical protein
VLCSVLMGEVALLDSGSAPLVWLLSPDIEFYLVLTGVALS